MRQSGRSSPRLPGNTTVPISLPSRTTPPEAPSSRCRESREVPDAGISGDTLEEAAPDRLCPDRTSPRSGHSRWRKLPSPRQRGTRSCTPRAAAQPRRSSSSRGAPFSSASKGHPPVQRPGVDMGEPQPRGQQLRHRALPAARRAVDRDDWAASSSARPAGIVSREAETIRRLSSTDPHAEAQVLLSARSPATGRTITPASSGEPS
jgi:hypothetical protein